MRVLKIWLSYSYTRQIRVVKIDIKGFGSNFRNFRPFLAFLREFVAKMAIFVPFFDCSKGQENFETSNFVPNTLNISINHLVTDCVSIANDKISICENYFPNNAKNGRFWPKWPFFTLKRARKIPKCRNLSPKPLISQ